MTIKGSTTKRQTSVLFVTTSFPTSENPASGIFVKRLVDSVPSHVKLTVLTPCGTSPTSLGQSPTYDLVCFRYAPWQWQTLAHQPGGIPAALEKSFLIKLVLPIFLLCFFWRCFREAGKVDIIHANWSVNGFICALANVFARRPMILTLRGTDISKTGSSITYRLILRFAIRASTVVTVVSNAMSDKLCAQFPQHQKRIISITNGVDNRLTDIPPRDSKHSKDNLNILVIANLIKLKNVPVILEAVSKLKGQISCNLRIIGEGPERDALIVQARMLELTEFVDFAGVVDPEKIIDYLKYADCLVLTSSSEGRPNVVLEAFAAGLPVIASDIDGVRELIGDNENGLLYKSGDSQMLAERLQELFYSDVLYRRYSRSGRDYILKHNLLWSDTGNQYAEIYDSLTSKAESKVAI